MSWKWGWDIFRLWRRCPQQRRQMWHHQRLRTLILLEPGPMQNMTLHLHRHLKTLRVPPKNQKRRTTQTSKLQCEFQIVTNAVMVQDCRRNSDKYFRNSYTYWTTFAAALHAHTIFAWLVVRSIQKLYQNCQRHSTLALYKGNFA